MAHPRKRAAQAITDAYGVSYTSGLRLLNAVYQQELADGLPTSLALPEVRSRIEVAATAKFGEPIAPLVLK